MSKPDDLSIIISDYVYDFTVSSELAFKTAQIALLDSLACALLALKVPECYALLGPIVPGTKVPLGARVPGTAFELDPIKAAFDISTCIRWLDYNDTWLAAEWGHPSDNLGGILAVLDFVSRHKIFPHSITMHDVLMMMIKAYEIQGVLALDNSFNAVGLDHVILVKLATTAVVSQCLGLNKSQATDAISQVWLDGNSLRTYRHAPNVGSRKSWAAGDATARGVQLAYWTKEGASGYPTSLSAKQWGFNAVYFKEKPLKLSRPFKSYVMENILFKVAFPAEFHAQTAIECAMVLYPEVKGKWDMITKIVITTQDSAMRIINKTGPLHNPADRDHCLQYTVAIALLWGTVESEHYSNEIAQDPRIDALRHKMQVIEDPEFTRDYLDPEKRSIANSVQIFFQDGTHSQKITIHYPLGHKSRRMEAMPLLQQKYYHAIASRFGMPDSVSTQQRILAELWEQPESWLSMPVHEFMDRWISSKPF